MEVLYMQMAQLDEALRYKQKGRGFDSQGSNCNFTLTLKIAVRPLGHTCNPCGRTMALGSTGPLTEISASNIPWGVTVAVPRADNLTTFTYRV
jgi:hypothetical protein